jgi:hypothetical protein
MGQVRRSARNSRQGTALAIMAALLLVVPATASAADLSSYITSVSPAQNAKLAFASKPDFQVISTCKGMVLFGYISRTATVGIDGEFLGGDVQDTFPL